MVFIILCIAILLYTVVSTIVIRLFGLEVVQNLNGKNVIALTFDDGPNPTYTNTLLDMLKKYHIHATFFVVGKHAEENPEIIKRMHMEGHTIGIHNYIHISDWILTPFGLRKQLSKASDVIEHITNTRPIYYRPPWGHLSLATPFECKKYKIIMWSHILGDWRIKNCSTKVLNGLRKAREQGGTIIVLHDDGENPGADNEAPKYMMKTLEVFLRESQKLGTKFVSISDSQIRGNNE